MSPTAAMPLAEVLKIERDRLLAAEMGSEKVVRYYDAILVEFFGHDIPISQALRLENQIAFARHRHEIHENSTSHIAKTISHLARAAFNALHPSCGERQRRTETVFGQPVLSTEGALLEYAGIEPDRIDRPDLTFAEVARFIDAIDRCAGLSAHAWRFAVLSLNIPAPTQALMNLQWKHLCSASRLFSVPYLLPGIGGMTMAPMALTDDLVRWAQIWQADRQDPEGYVLTGATAKTSDRQASLRPLIRRYSERLGIRHLGVRSFSNFCQMQLHTALDMGEQRGSSDWIHFRPDPERLSRAAAQVLGGITSFLERPYYPEAQETDTKIAWTMITADELKALVWSEPTQKLKEQFGVSDVAIAKKCRKLGIEKPPRGYWNKVAVGKDTRSHLQKHGVAVPAASAGVSGHTAAAGH